MKSENERVEQNEETVARKPDFDSLLSQVDRLENELETERKKNAEQINRMKYLQADLVNLQRQTDRMVNDAKNQVKNYWLLQIISIKEDLDRALKTGSEDSVLKDGLKLLLARIEGDLKSEQVESIKVEVGMKFDPRFHDAVSFREIDDREDGGILSVIGNGYTVLGKVIRPALVEVARRTKPLSNERSQAET